MLIKYGRCALDQFPHYQAYADPIEVIILEGICFTDPDSWIVSWPLSSRKDSSFADASPVVEKDCRVLAVDFAALVALE
jgi:hypothetical protein